MPGRGPAPKPVRSRARANVLREANATHLVPDGVLRGPDLPERPGGDPWPAQTLVFWDILRRSPMAATWLPVDFQFGVDTMTFHARLWDGEVSVGPELRLRVGKLACTPEDRLRMHIRIDAEIATAPEPTGSMTKQRRSRLLRAVTTDPSKENHDPR